MIMAWKQCPSSTLMHQSFETPAPFPHVGPRKGLGGAFTSDTLHVGSPVGREFAGSHGLYIPYQRNKWSSHSLVICMSTLLPYTCNCSHFAKLINHRVLKRLRHASMATKFSVLNKLTWNKMAVQWQLLLCFLSSKMRINPFARWI